MLSSVDGLILPLVLLGLAAQPASDESRARAFELAEESETAYREGRFDASAALLAQAYELDPDPILLFNLARVLDDAGRFEEALRTYRSYLAEANPPRDRARIEARVHILERLIRERESASREPAPPAPSSEQAALLRVQGPSPSPASWGPWVAMGTGAASAIAGTIFAVLAEDHQSQAEDEPIQIRAQDALDTAETYGTVRTVTWIAGGALLAGGLIWLLARPKDSTALGPQVDRPSAGRWAIRF